MKTARTIVLASLLAWSVAGTACDCCTAKQPPHGGMCDECKASLQSRPTPSATENRTRKGTPDDGVGGREGQSPEEKRALYSKQTAARGEKSRLAGSQSTAAHGSSCGEKKKLGQCTCTPPGGQKGNSATGRTTSARPATRQTTKRGLKEDGGNGSSRLEPQK